MVWLAVMIVVPAFVISILLLVGWLVRLVWRTRPFAEEEILRWAVEDRSRWILRAGHGQGWRSEELELSLRRMGFWARARFRSAYAGDVEKKGEA